MYRAAAVLLAFVFVPAITRADSEIDWYSPSTWKTLDGRPVDQNWAFTDDEIRLENPRGGNGSIVSPPVPAHFELSWKWKIDRKCNTGVKYRVRKFGKQLFNDRYLGVEYQIIDDAPTSVSKGSTASIYDLVAPGKKQLHAIGEWNEARVVAVGDRLEHYLNGELVAAADTIGPTWERTIALSKFYGSVDFGRPKEGDRLMLTDHGGKAVYKDFQLIAKPAPEPTPEPKRAGPFLANAMRNSWADQTSIVLWTRTTAGEEFVADGKAFITLSSGDSKKLGATRDAEKILRAQIPEGAELDEMLGACPGAAGQVRLMYFPGKQRNQTKSTDWITTSADRDFTAQWKLDDLKPGTKYAAIVEARGKDGGETTAVVRGSFRTAPAAAKAEDLTFCFTTCHDFIRRDDGLNGHKIYPSMTQIDPHFVVHAGDIEYYDKPDPWAMTKELMRFKWGRIFALPNNRQFYNTTSSYFLKDDHDSPKNDCWAGQSYGTVTFEEGVRIFNDEQFPSHSPRYKTVRWGKGLQVCSWKDVTIAAPTRCPMALRKRSWAPNRRPGCSERSKNPTRPSRLSAVRLRSSGRTERINATTTPTKCSCTKATKCVRSCRRWKT